VIRSANLVVVEVAEREVGVPVDALLGKRHERRIAAVPVDRVHPEPGHRDPDAPVVAARDVGRLAMQYFLRTRERMLLVSDARPVGRM
jgi:hypothetical protein